MQFDLKSIISTIIAGLTLIFASCTKTEEPEYVEEVTPQVIFLFSPGGLGDLSYCDCILSGVQKFKMNHPEVDIFIYSPQSVEEAEKIFTDWLKRPGSDIPVVFALASSDYESLVDTHIGEYELADNKRILLFESLKDYRNDKISTFQVSMFGASFLAGACARELIGEERSLILLGCVSDIPIQSAKDGFIAGLGNPNYDIQYLADDWSGYVMANATYQNMAEWSRLYGYIFPVAGGSNTGLYRYTREYSESPYLAGMDVDQSYLSTKITGSVVKRFDIIINEYFTYWLQTGNLPQPAIYGLGSGYVDWQIAPLYQQLLGDVADRHRPTAQQKENEYY